MRYLFILLALAGCATDQGVARVETQIVDKPVPVPCLTPDQVPQPPTKATVKSGASFDQKAAAVGIELDRWRQYGSVATPLLQSCSTLPPIPPTMKGGNP